MSSFEKREIEELREALEELRSELPINPIELDEECRRQPEKFELVGQFATQAKALSRKAKDNLDYIEAEVKSKIRQNPEEFGLVGRITNDAVNEATTIHKDVMEAKRDYIEISKISDSLAILVQSMEQRKAMIRDLVSLYVHNYYSNHSLAGEEKSLDEQFEEDLAEERSRDIRKEN